MKNMLLSRGAREAAKASAGALHSKTILSPVIGIEVHAQLLSATKLFSPSRNYDGREDDETPPNMNCALFDAATPGTLPAVNENCVRLAIAAGLALNGTIEQRSIFERKHYFYADLPPGYQITQQRHPIVTKGSLEFPVAKHGAPSRRKNVVNLPNTARARFGKEPP